jgi:hypothetical protein
MINTYISNIFDGFNKAYIYIWLSKKHKAVYVGMTNSSSGTLGRAGSHISKRGTLRKRFLQKKGYSPNQVDDFILLTFILPQKQEFISTERSYREAVEYLVQKELLIIRGNLTPSFDVISWVRMSPRTGNSQVKKMANQIIDEFKTEYPSL